MALHVTVGKISSTSVIWAQAKSGVVKAKWGSTRTRAKARSPCTQYEPRPGRQEPSTPGPATLPSSPGAAGPAAEGLGRWSLASADSRPQSRLYLMPVGNVLTLYLIPRPIPRVNTTCSQRHDQLLSWWEQPLSLCYMASFSSHLNPTTICEVVILYSLHR